MEENTIGDEIAIIAESCINNINFPLKCKITRIYPEGRVDVETDSGKITYAEVIGNHLEIGNVGILVFLNNKNTDYIIITK